MGAVVVCLFIGKKKLTEKVSDHWLQVEKNYGVDASLQSSKVIRV